MCLPLIPAVITAVTLKQCPPWHMIKLPKTVGYGLDVVTVKLLMVLMRMIVINHDRTNVLPSGPRKVIFLISIRMATSS